MAAKKLNRRRGKGLIDGGVGSARALGAGGEGATKRSGVGAWMAGSRWLAGWGVILYAVLFFLVKIGEIVGPDGQPLALTRLQPMMLWLVPEDIWRIWTADGTMPIGWFDRVPILLAAGIWLGMGYGFGRVLLKRLGLWESLRYGERLGLGSAFGLHLLSWITSWLGVVGGLKSGWWLISVLAGLAGLAWWLGRVGSRGEVLKEWRASGQGEREVGGGMWGRRWRGWLALAGVLMGGLILAGAVLPPMEFDVREYHLQGPKEFAASGEIAFAPHNVYLNMPLGLEMHSLAWMVIWDWSSLPGDAWYQGALVGKCIQASMALLAAMLIGGVVERWAGAMSGWMAGVLFLMCPGVGEVSRLGLIDIGLGFYALASFAVLVLWFERRREQVGETRGESMGMVVAAGWMLGGAVGCKYTAVPMVLLPGLLTWVAMEFSLGRVGVRGREWRGVLVRGGLLLLMVLVSGGVWYVKNGMATGNPVYPLMGKVFAGDPRSVEQIEQWDRAHQVPRLGGGEAMGPDYRVQRLGLDLYQALLSSRYLGLLLVPLAIWGWMGKRNALNSLSLYWVMAMVGIWWLSTHRLERFLLPAYPLMAVAAGLGSRSAWRWLGGIPIMVLSGFGALYGLIVIASMPWTDVRIGVSLDALRYDRAIDRVGVDETFSRVSAYQRWLNEHIGEGELVLMIGDAQVFDLECEVRYSTCFDRSIMEELLALEDVGERRARLAREGITHVVVHWGEIRRYRGPGNYGFEKAVGSESIQRLIDQGILERVSWPILSETADLYRVLHPSGESDRKFE